MTLVLVAAVAVLYGAGAYLMLQRNLARIVIGLAMIAHGANLLLLLAGGPPAGPPMVGLETSAMSDPLPQAMALTAIVITFGITAFLLAMIYLSRVFHGDDVVQHDLDDRRIERGTTSEDHP